MERYFLQSAPLHGEECQVFRCANKYVSGSHSEITIIIICRLPPVCEGALCKDYLFSFRRRIQKLCVARVSVGVRVLSILLSFEVCFAMHLSCVLLLFCGRGGLYQPSCTEIQGSDSSHTTALQQPSNVVLYRSFYSLGGRLSLVAFCGCERLQLSRQ